MEGRLAGKMEVQHRDSAMRQRHWGGTLLQGIVPKTKISCSVLTGTPEFTCESPSALWFSSDSL